MAQNDIQVEILEDGRIKLTTGTFNMAVHAQAEKLFAEIERLAGGTVEKRRTKEHHHHHGHGQEHHHHH